MQKKLLEGAERPVWSFCECHYKFPATGSGYFFSESYFFQETLLEVEFSFYICEDRNVDRRWWRRWEEEAWVILLLSTTMWKKTVARGESACDLRQPVSGQEDMELSCTRGSLDCTFERISNWILEWTAQGSGGVTLEVAIPGGV